MTVTDVRKDPAALTLTITAEFLAPVEKVWDLWADPRRLERWWGPPGYPATFVEHDLAPGGTVTYFMTSPEGERYHGYWRVVEVAPPSLLVVDDGFADDEGAPNPDLPVTRMRVDLAAVGEGCRMVVTSTFATTEAMEQVLAMGAADGMTLAIGQMVDLLDAGATTS